MIFLDTSIVVDLLRGRKPELRKHYGTVRASGEPLAISSIVLFELWFGARNSAQVEQNLGALNTFLEDAITIVPFDEADAVEAGVIRAELSRTGTVIGPYDMLIAAQARARRATLVTGNVREFERVPDLHVTDWAAQ